jgi:hypothetical protein
VDTALLFVSFVCALGATIFAALDPGGWMPPVLGAASFVAAAYVATAVAVPAPAAVSLLAAVAAAWHLVRAPRSPLTLAWAGILAGVWAGLLRAQQCPLGLAIAIAVMPPVVSWWLARRRPHFAPPRLREEALLCLIVVGVVAAAAPGLTDGWHAAVDLSLQSSGAGEAARISTPAWAAASTVVALVSGGLFSLWSRR